ncbi:large ribosomal subunit protein bL35m-like [Haliotis cracherodii]|uniref:large ribosomal subunit protein bL35m-like n=1 Tax=Haliotis cracherodii TaxID=6455 RepID=UPI0039EBEB79
MAAAVRNRATIMWRLGWNVVSQSRPVVPKDSGNIAALCRMFSGSLKVSQCRSFSASPLISNRILKMNTEPTIKSQNTRCLLQPPSPTLVAKRNKVYYSKRKGKPKAIKAVTNRFYRLDWGIWIRTQSGRHKRIWKKSPSRRYLSRQHLFCNKQQSRLLDKMTTDYWHRPRHYVDDPYAPYQKRTNLQKYFPEKRPFYP